MYVNKNKVHYSKEQNIYEIKGFVTHKSLDVDLRLVAKNSFLFDLLFDVPVNSFGNVGTLAVERESINQTNKNSFS